LPSLPIPTRPRAVASPVFVAISGAELLRTRWKRSSQNAGKAKFAEFFFPDVG
jgi:hypothetical protein